MNHPEQNPDEAWVAAMKELCFLGAIGVPWSRMAASIAEAEQLPLLKIEQEEALHRGQPFVKLEQLRRAEAANQRVILYGRFIGARVVARMTKLARSVEEGPKCRFSDKAILESFGKLPRWDVDPADEEIASVIRRLSWLAGRGGNGST
ncbi:MAG TPA: hypothetical protein VM223_11745 [Planctomycetota bacterium]|nr:hypothetical protein [Planctomycetota bacterium]